MRKRTWLEEQIISAKQETESWSEWKREAMRIDDQNVMQAPRADNTDTETSTKKRA